ncbi:MAG: hypothetical protein ABSH50_29415 [Bryobacteraceae bacterium]|jgi:hypothetical protein
MELKALLKCATWKTTEPYTFIAVMVGVPLMVAGWRFPTVPDATGGHGMMGIIALWPQALSIVAFVLSCYGLNRFTNTQARFYRERDSRLTAERYLKTSESTFIFAGKMQLLAEEAERLRHDFSQMATEEAIRGHLAVGALRGLEGFLERYKAYRHHVYECSANYFGSPMTKQPSMESMDSADVDAFWKAHAKAISNKYGETIRDCKDYITGLRG